MTDGLRDIVMKIKAEFDDKSAEKSAQNYLRKVADNSKIALNKTIEDTEKTVSEGMKSVSADLESLTKNADGDMFTRAADAVQVFNDRVAQIGKSESIDALTAKLYKLEQRLNSTAQNILGLQNDFEQIQKASEGKEILTLKYGSIDEAKAKMKELSAEADKLTSELGYRGAKSGPGNLLPMQETFAQIEELKAKLQDLKAEYTKLSESGDINDKLKLTDLSSEIAKVTSQIGNLSKQFYNIGREANFGQTKKEIKDTYALADAESKLRKELSDIRNIMALIGQSSTNTVATLTELANQGASFDKIVEAIRAIAKAEEDVDDKTKKISQSAEKAHGSFNQWRNAVWSVSRLLGNVYTIGLDVVRGAKQIANFYMKIWNAAKKVVAIFKKLSSSIRKTADEHAKSWKQMLKDVIRYSLGIRSLFMLFRRLRRYIKEAFEEMAKQIPEVNANLSALKSSFNALKGSLATALEPALAALINHLTTIIDLLAKALTYVGMFIAALSGRGYVYQAKKVATSFADAAGSAKELNKQLQGFDELNNLTSDKGGGGGADSPLAQFEKVNVPDWIQNLADTLKKAWETFLGPIKDAWAKIGDEVVKAWTRAFSNVKNLLMDIARDFLKAWTSGLGESIATSFFKILRDIGNIVANIAEKIRDAWNAVEEGASKSNGLRFWEAVLGVIDKILAGIQRITEDMADWTSKLNLTPMFEAIVHWLESLVPLAEMFMDILFNIWDRALKPILTWAFDGENSGIGRFFQILADFNNKLDKEKIVEDLNKIWDALGRFGQNVGEGLLIFIERMTDKLANWLNSDDFTQWCEDVAEFLDGLEPEELADDLEQVVRIIQNIAKELWNAIKFVIDHKDEILDALEWASTHLKEIAAVFLGGKLAIDVARFAANIALAAGAFSKLFAGAEGGTTIFSVLAGVLSGPVLAAIGAVAAAIGALLFAYDGVAGVVEKIKETATNVINSLKEKADKLGISEKIEKLKTAFDNLMTTLQPFIELLRGALKVVFDHLFKRIGEIITLIGSELLNVVSAGITMLTGVIDFINGFLTVIKGAINVIVGLFTGDLDRARQGAETIWNGIKDIFKGSIEFVKGLFTGFVDFILEPFKQIKYQLIGDPIVIDMWDGIKKVFEESIGKIIEFVKNLKDKVIEFFTNLKDKVIEQIDNIKKKFEEWKENAKQVKDDVIASLSDLKTQFVEIFEGIKEGIKAPINGILGLVESLINKIIEGFNGFGSKIGDLSFETPDWLPGDLGGKKFELKLPELKKISIPRLAQGAVIPPNKEFLALLGDQKRGTNIETPLSTMVEAFNMANKGGNEEELALLREQNNLLRQLAQKEFGISEREIYRSVINQDTIYRKSTGNSAFAY